MSIFDTLKLAVGIPAQQQQQTAPQNTQTASPVAPQHPPASQDPAAPNQQAQLNGAVPQTKEGEVNPLDTYNDLFKPKEVDPNAPPAQTVAVEFDQAKVVEGLGKMDFMRFADPKDLAAVAAGGEGAVVALGNLMNSVMRQSMLMNSQFSASAANKAADFAYQRANQGIPEMVRGQLTNNQFSDAASQHPALQPLVQTLSAQYRQQFPKATPEQVATQVREYLKAVGGALNPQSQEAEQKKNASAGGQDWGAWFGNAG